MSTKRYNLVLPQEIYDQVQAIADQHHETVLTVLRKFVKLGLLVAAAEETPGPAFILRTGDREQELVLL